MSAQELPHTPQSGEVTGDSMGPSSLYLELIAKLSGQGELPPPQTPEEAVQRLSAAQEVYESLEPPKTSLPDTPARSLKELLLDRQQQYWLDRGEIRTGDMAAVDEFVPMLDSSPHSNALRLALNLPQEVPDEVFQWAVAKSLLAGRIWQEVQNAWVFGRQGDLDMDLVADESYRSEVTAMMQGRARIEIQDGQPVLVPNDFTTVSQAVGAEIHKRHTSWQEKHEIMSRSSKMRVVGPLVADALTSARSVWALGDLAQFHYGEYYGYGNGSRNRAAQKAVEHTIDV